MLTRISPRSRKKRSKTTATRCGTLPRMDTVTRVYVLARQLVLLLVGAYGLNRAAEELEHLAAELRRQK